MSAPYFDTQSKAEAALKALLEDISATNRGNATVFAGLGMKDELTLPRIECVCGSGGDEDPLDTGNFWHSATITIMSQIDDDTLATHRSRVAYVVDKIFDDGLDTALSAKVTDFCVMGVRNRRVLKQEKEDRHVSTQIEVDLLIAPQDF